MKIYPIVFKLQWSALMSLTPLHGHDTQVHVCREKMSFRGFVSWHGRDVLREVFTMFGHVSGSSGERRCFFSRWSVWGAATSVVSGQNHVCVAQTVSLSVACQTLDPFYCCNCGELERELFSKVARVLWCHKGYWVRPLPRWPQPASPLLLPPSHVLSHFLLIRSNSILFVW